MNITTEFVLRSPSLPLVSITETLQPDKVECVHALCLDADVRTFSVQFDLDDDVSESELSALDEVTEATLLGETSDRMVYQLTVELESSVAEAFTTEHIDATQLESATISKSQWHETKLFKDYETFNEFRASCEDNGILWSLYPLLPIRHDLMPRHPESPSRQRRDERGVLGEFLTALDQRSPGRPERRTHIHPSRLHA